jgi:hypothetical protein
MQIVIETEEAWALMTLITGYVIDKSGVSQDGKQAIRQWRTQRALGTVELSDLTIAMNAALGTFVDEKTTRKIHQRGRVVTTKVK